MRVIWSTLTEPGVQRKNAFSLDATCEELLFVAGPVIAAALVTASSPSTGIIVSAIFATIGALGLAFSSASQAVPRNDGHAPREDRPLRQPGFLRVLIALIGVGLVLGVMEVFAPAHAAANNAVEMSGWLLAAFAAGSRVAPASRCGSRGVRCARDYFPARKTAISPWSARRLESSKQSNRAALQLPGLGRATAARFVNGLGYRD